MSRSKKKIYYDGIEFDSSDKFKFYCWCKEALTAGFIERFDYQPKSFNLTEKTSNTIKTGSKCLDSFLSQPHTYTPDFIIIAKSRFNKFNHDLFAMDKITYYIDIKRGLSNDEREFTINRRWVWQKHGLFMNKLDIEEFFRKTFFPISPKSIGTGQTQNKDKELAA